MIGTAVQYALRSMMQKTRVEISKELLRVNRARRTYLSLGFDTLDQFRPTANVSNAMFEAAAAGLADKIAKKIIS